MNFVSEIELNDCRRLKMLYSYNFSREMVP
jgi:hypothetical protein